MTIKIVRTGFFDRCTIGELYLDDQFYCYTLEDKDRKLYDSMSLDEIKSIKIDGETAIPYGEYSASITYSNKFKKFLPELFDVKGFENIRIHGGNTSEDTSGCILVGKSRDGERIFNCREVLDVIINLIIDNKNKLKVCIMDGYSDAENRRLEEINKKISEGKYDLPAEKIPTQPLIENTKVNEINSEKIVLFKPDMTIDEMKEAIEILKTEYNLNSLLKGKYPFNLMSRDLVSGAIGALIITILQFILKGC